MSSSQQQLCLNIHGMHCASCEVLIERKFKKIAGVENVRVNHATGKAKIIVSSEPSLKEFQEAIRGDGYHVTWTGGSQVQADQQNGAQEAHHRPTSKDYKETAVVFVIIVALYFLLKQFKLIPDSLGLTEQMSYGFIFVIGLVAALSTCIAVTGGLLLAVAAKYNSAHPELTGRQRFRPHLYFNAGRIVSYTVLGGLLGAFGGVFQLSTKATGWITILVSFVMIALGFQLLKLFPWMRRFQPKMPKFLAHKIHDWSETDRKGAPFFLGASTFFLPCGFTQALQLYVLSQGDFKTGALTMFAFSLGTLPALLSLSAISSFAKGSFQRYFLKFAGVLVILIGFANINNGLALTGNALRLSSGSSSPSVTQAGADPNVQIINGVQVAAMTVDGYDYSPSQFTVQAGIPVRWEIDGTRSAGCAQVITAPNLGITEYLPSTGTKSIEFTPTTPGRYAFSCSMGMTTPGAAFIVIPASDTGGQQVLPSSEGNTPDKIPCDPSVQQCLDASAGAAASDAQNVAMTVTRERGFYPNQFSVKKGKPVELAVDVQVPLGGCMGTMVIPDYDLAKKLTKGQVTTFQFTPTKTGVIPVTCSMGSVLAEFTITN